jgi:Zn-dependent M28 family amino/carboxypeptidase
VTRAAGVTACRFAVLGSHVLIVLAALNAGGCFQTTLPGKSFSGETPALTDEQVCVRENLRRHVHMLAGEIGERNLWRNEALDRAAEYIAGEFRAAGYEPTFQSYKERGRLVHNVIAEFPGSERPDQIVIIGAHYDTVRGSPGADDNASGVAATIELARAFRAGGAHKRTVRFIAFVNEEEPFFWTGRMGSRMYAKRCKRLGENVVGMISLEMLGYYRGRRGSQCYPPPFNFFYPSRGNFVAFLSNNPSRRLMNSAGAAFRRRTAVSSEGLASAEFVVGHSDQWSFWKSGFKAIMLTDTAMFRNPNYHKSTDTPATLDYDSLARVTAGVSDVARALADSDERY